MTDSRSNPTSNNSTTFETPSKTKQLVNDRPSGEVLVRHGRCFLLGFHFNQRQ